MKLYDLALIRLASQHLIQHKHSTPGEIVKYLGAMQAQDYPMAKWALGARIPSSTDLDVEDAISKASIIRTHLLRPTWHFVSAEDIYWILDLTATQVKSAQSYREKQLELTQEVFSLSNRVIEKTLGGGIHCTRDELISALKSAGIPTDQNRASHLLARAELEKIICSGETRNNKTTYALLSERVPVAHSLSKEESLAELAGRYFTSRAPATLQDFTWWSGLPARDASLGLDMIKNQFSSDQIEGHTFWYPQDIQIPNAGLSTVFLLPTYDEYIISYTERSASIPPALEQHMKEISDRGVFWPILVLDGQVTGIWKRIVKKEHVILEIQPFSPLNHSASNLVVQAAGNFADFLGKQLELVFQP